MLKKIKPLRSAWARIYWFTQGFKSRYEKWFWENLISRLVKSTPNPFFIEIGAMDGISFDPIYLLVKRHHLSGLLLEPIRAHFDKLKNNYRDQEQVILVNKALAPKNGPLHFYTIDPAAVEKGLVPPWAGGISSQFCNRNQIGGEGMPIDEFEKLKPHIRELEVEGITFSDLCQEYAIKKLDLIVIDCEGADFDILQQIPVDRFDTKIIRIEYCHLESTEQRRLWSWFSEKGFHVKTMGIDAVAWRNL